MQGRGSPPSHPGLERSSDGEHFAGTGTCCWSCKPSPACSCLPPVGCAPGCSCPPLRNSCLPPGLHTPQGLKGELQLVRDDVITLNYYSQTGFFKQEFREDLAPTPWLCLLRYCGSVLFKSPSAPCVAMCAVPVCLAVMAPLQGFCVFQ